MKQLFGFVTIAILQLLATGASAAFDQEHKSLTKALNQVVVYKENTGTVKYKDLIRKPADLINYFKDVSRVSEKEFKTWTEPEQIAFLINVYNASTLQLVKDYYPITSIKKIPGTKDALKMKFFRLFGREMSLEQLHNDYLRARYTEPRIHFALNCATVACPRLRNEAYVGSRLNEQLDDQVKTFLRDSERNKIDVAAKNLQLSQMFEWFADDFKKGDMTLTKWIAPYISDDDAVRKELAEGKYKVSHLAHDWNLNKE